MSKGLLMYYHVFIFVYAFRLPAQDKQLMDTADTWLGLRIAHQIIIFLEEKDVYVMFMSVISRFCPVRISLEKRFDAECKHTKHFSHNVFSQVLFAPNHGICCQSFLFALILQ